MLRRDATKPMASPSYKHHHHHPIIQEPTTSPRRACTKQRRQELRVIILKLESRGSISTQEPSSPEDVRSQGSEASSKQIMYMDATQSSRKQGRRGGGRESHSLGQLQHCSLGQSPETTTQQTQADMRQATRSVGFFISCSGIARCLMHGWQPNIPHPLRHVHPSHDALATGPEKVHSEPLGGLEYQYKCRASTTGQMPNVETDIF